MDKLILFSLMRRRNAISGILLLNLVHLFVNDEALPSILFMLSFKYVKKTYDLLTRYPAWGFLKIFPSRCRSFLSLMQTLHKTNSGISWYLLHRIDIGYVCRVTLFPLLLTPETNTYGRGTWCCRTAIRERRNNAKCYRPTESRLKSNPFKL